ncbi:UDP-glucose 4-epimerase GalE [Anaerophilus nitritogenes]|uniref:UDP-glucose 4-epimerase GalE n=1 Tax=Anaerophilus nitritogenes TaxID=2498136 RepID=UPI00101D22A2|nr:UDP-glucose 4-epimerase GalE [Anaerophilus nitritogenes]
MSILVTGGAGYIGSHTVKELVNQGKDVIVLDNLQKGHKKAIDYVNFIKGDISDENLVSKVIKEYHIDRVIHFAADSLVGESMIDPSKYYNNNVIKTIKLLDTMIQNHVKKIVFSSTAATYGEPKEVPIKEDFETNPTNVYGKTKLMIESILKDYDMAYGLKYISLRYFNAAGAYESGEIGEDHNPETHLIPIIMQVLLGKRDKIYIYGDDYDTVDGTCIRDYIHVTDLSNAHILALKALENGSDSSIYNLGCGEGYSVKEVMHTVEKVTGLKVNREMAQRRAGDPAKLIASSQKIKKELGWNPKYSLYDIIKTAWKWHKNHPNGY